MEQKPVVYISLSSLNWALSCLANGVGQFSYIEDKTDGGCNIPLFTADQIKAEREKAISEYSEAIEHFIGFFDVDDYKEIKAKFLPSHEEESE